MTTWISWILYAGALFGLCVTLGATFYFRKALSMFYGHIAIGAGFTVLCACLAYLVGSDPPLVLRIVVTGIGIAGYLLLRWGRRRSREVNRFFKTMEDARAKQSAPPAA